MSEIVKLKPFINNEYRESATDTYTDVYNPSTGEVIAKAPRCTKEEVLEAVAAAKAAYPGWRATPILKRVQLFYKLKALIDANMEDLTMSVARENGKAWKEAEGDVLKAREMTELACSMPSIMMGESLMNASSGYDTVTYREPLGVFAGIAPWNFPAMIPMGWMSPLGIVCGNTYVLKAASPTPMTALKFVDLYRQAGFPAGVINVVTCSRHEAEVLLTHEDVKGITFVGSTSVGLHVYSTAAAAGKRVQALCEAKNHALVMEDADIPRTAAGIINSSFGCAGERCMALPALCVQESIADKLVAEIVRRAKELKVGPAYDKATQLGPVGTPEHFKFVSDWIQKGVDEGAKLILDGRGVKVPGYENGLYIGPTIFDHVTPEMTIGQREVFGPVLCIKRVKDFEDGITQMNANPFANGSVIFTNSGYYAREFAWRTDGGQVGINVGIPVPVGIFSFTGHKRSFFGDLHCHGKDSFRFFTETKTVTTRWFENVTPKKDVTVDTWDGSMNK